MKGGAGGFSCPPPAWHVELLASTVLTWLSASLAFCNDKGLGDTSCFNSSCPADPLSSSCFVMSTNLQHEVLKIRRLRGTKHSFTSDFERLSSDLRFSCRSLRLFFRDEALAAVQRNSPWAFRFRLYLCLLVFFLSTESRWKRLFLTGWFTCKYENATPPISHTKVLKYSPLLG